MPAGKFSLHIWLCIFAIRGCWMLIRFILVPFFATLTHGLSFLPGMQHMLQCYL
jgi:hypothetical protein